MGARRAVPGRTPLAVRVAEDARMEITREDLVYYLGLDPLAALAVVLSTTVLYYVFVLLLVRTGQRLQASGTSLELAVIAVLGAVVGRALLGPTPTLSGGLLALATLFVLERLSGRVGRSATRVIRRRAVAVVVAGQPDRAVLRLLGVDDAALWAALRGVGVRSLSEVVLVVVERSGKWSVLRAGDPVHPAALTGVRDATTVRERLASAGC